MEQEQSTMKRSQSHVLHLASLPSILKIVREELVAGWGTGVNIMSFTDAVSAARQVLFVPDAPIRLAIVDSETERASHFVVALRDIYPSCPVILTSYEESAGLPELLCSDNIEVLTKPFTAKQLIEAADRCLNCTPIR